MAASDLRSEGSDRLDELLGEFAESGYAPRGAEVEGGDAAGADEPAHGHDHPGHDAGHGGHGDHGHGGHGGAESVREFEYRGHRVQIVTRYEVTIDGELWEGGIGVLPNGSVISHYLPQYALPSAADFIRAVIDQWEAPPEIREAAEAGEGEKP
jgi:hypothetical protein